MKIINGLIILLMTIIPIIILAASDSSSNKSVAAIQNTTVTIAPQKSDSFGDSSSLTISERDLFKLRQEFVELKNKYSQDYIGITTLILMAITVIIAIFQGFIAYYTQRNYKMAKSDMQNIIKSVQDEAAVLIRTLKDDSMSAQNLIKSHTDLCQDLSQKMNESFSRTLQRREKLTQGILAKLGEIIRPEIDKDKLHRLFDEVFEGERQFHTIEGFLTDLKNPSKEKRRLAVWGIEAMGPEANINDLQKVADDEKEDVEIREEAKRAIANMRRRLGL